MPVLIPNVVNIVKPVEVYHYRIGNIFKHVTGNMSFQ